MKQNLLSISANALRTCLTRYNFDVSFENLHVNCKKCTPKQITLYQSSLKLFKTLNDNLEDLTFEQITVLDQIRCATRQLNFEIECTNNYKIGMNTTANKFFSLSKKIGLGMLHLKFVHFKKLAKIQFLKYGRTWYMKPFPSCWTFVLFIHAAGQCLKIVRIVPNLRDMPYELVGEAAWVIEPKAKMTPIKPMLWTWMIELFCKDILMEFYYLNTIHWTVWR